MKNMSTHRPLPVRYRCVSRATLSSPQAVSLPINIIQNGAAARLKSATILTNAQVEAVMLDCTGTRPKSLETSPPAPLQISCSSNSSDECVTFSVASVHSNGSAPVSDGFLAPTVHGSDSTAFHGRILPTVPAESAPNNADAASVSTLASSGACTAAPSPPSRNLVIEFGDYAGERVTRSALSRAAASSADRVDPRAVVSVERSAISKLQNPRLVSIGDRLVSLVTRFASKPKPYQNDLG